MDFTQQVQLLQLLLQLFNIVVVKTSLNRNKQLFIAVFSLFFFKFVQIFYMLTDKDYIAAGNLLDVDPALIKAVCFVESSGNGFDKNGNVIARFEPYWFYKFLKRCYQKDLTPYYNDLRYKNSIIALSFKDSIYGMVSMQWAKILKAAELAERLCGTDSPAYNAASYGMFQIMGYHYDVCNFKSAREMVGFMKESEYNQLVCFVRFIKSQGLDKYLKDKNFTAFAYRYNGPYYKQVHYDEKIKNYYLRFKDSMTNVS